MMLTFRKAFWECCYFDEDDEMDLNGVNRVSSMFDMVLQVPEVTLGRKDQRPRLLTMTKPFLPLGPRDHHYQMYHLPAQL